MPVVRRQRLPGVDVARGLAVLGMAAVHVLPLRDDVGVRTTADLVVSGRSAATFAVLAGVGVAFATRGADRRSAALSLALRGVAVGLLGLLLGALDSGVLVILAFYGLFFVLLAPLARLSTRTALLAAAGVALLGPPLSQLLRAGRDSAPFNPVFADLRTPGALLEQLLLTGTYPALPWLAYLLLGLGVGRLPLTRARTAVALLLSGAALALVAHLASALLLGPVGGYDALAGTTSLATRLADRPGATVPYVVDACRFGTVPTDSPWWLAVDARHSSAPPDLAATAGVALAVLGVSLLAARVASRLLAPLGAVGSMPLTVYSCHLVWLALTDTTAPGRYYLAQVVVALVVATLWRRFFGRGPLEAGLAALTRLVRGRLRAAA